MSAEYSVFFNGVDIGVSKIWRKNLFNAIQYGGRFRCRII